MTLERKPLREIAEESAFAAADVAFLAGLNEATVSRLWDDPDWLNRIRGHSLQALIATVPGVGEYLCTHSLASRRIQLLERLASYGIAVDELVFQELVTRRGVPEQHLGNALAAVLQVMAGDARKAAEHLSRCWGLNRDLALACAFAPPDRDGLLPDGRGLLQDPLPVIEAATAMANDLAKRSNSFHACLAYASLAHHLARTTGHDGLITPDQLGSRTSALAWRSTMMGLIVETGNEDITARYLQTLSTNSNLARVDAWAIPGQVRDIPLSPSFWLPSKHPLPRTANEVLYEIRTYNDAYLAYLVQAALPTILQRDPTFGMRVPDLQAALESRLDSADDPALRNASSQLIATLKASQ